jgi:hypothetical protein
MVSGYGLDDRAIEFLSPAETKDFSSSLCIQTGSGAHPASCTLGTRGPFSGAKARPGRDADHSPHLMPRSSMSRSYTSFPPSAFMACSGRVLASWLSVFKKLIHASWTIYLREIRFLSKFGHYKNTWSNCWLISAMFGTAWQAKFLLHSVQINLKWLIKQSDFNEKWNGRNIFRKTPPVSDYFKTSLFVLELFHAHGQAHSQRDG